MPLALTGPLPPLEQLANPAINLDDKELADQCRLFARHLHGLTRRTTASNEIMLTLMACASRLDPRKDPLSLRGFGAGTATTTRK